MGVWWYLRERKRQDDCEHGGQGHELLREDDHGESIDKANGTSDRS
jgi:hypothetical protein